MVQITNYINIIILNVFDDNIVLYEFLSIRLYFFLTIRYIISFN
jgi:hypothetical protein